MGITAQFYAVEGSSEVVEKALHECWPDELSGLVTHERSQGSAVDTIYRNTDGAQLVLWRDGRFTVFAESELWLVDEKARAKLSASVNGTVIAVVIGDHGGCYYLDVYRNGELTRRLSSEEEPRGAALPEESGVDVSNFRDTQIEKIWKAFGLKHYYEGVPPFRVMSVKMPTREVPTQALVPPEPSPKESPAAAPTKKATKPWWSVFGGWL